MERKNTMLLTVIAVATLLVAVVGATFAYYSVTGNRESETRTVTTTTPTVGSVALTSAGTNLYLKISGDQMAETAKDTYYHQTSDIYADTTQRWSPVANFKVTGSDADTTYSCLFRYTITTTGSMTEVQGDQALKAADAGITLRAGTATGANPTFTELPTTRQAITTTTGTGVTGTAKFQVKSNTDVNIEASAEFDTHNLQNELANKSMVTSVTFDKLTCLTGTTYPSALAE